MTMTLPQLIERYADDLRQVEATLQETAITSEHLAYVLKAGGHRWRPLLAILCFHYTSRHADRNSNAYQVALKRLYRLAAALELLHTASLVHDDVIDESSMRRQQPTLNVKTSNTLAVLSGNLFYLSAFRHMVSLNNSEWLLEIIATAEAMCLGEIIQLDTLEVEISTESYLSIIEKKTGRLIQVSGKLGAALGFEAYETQPALSPMNKEKEIASLTAIAGLMGLLSQLKDDLQDGDIGNYDANGFITLRKEKSLALEALIQTMDMTSPPGQALLAIIQYFKE